MKNTAKVEKVKQSHRKIYTDIIINAKPEKVWETLTDTTSYKNWATFLIGIEGDIKDKSKIEVTFQMKPEKEKYNKIEHTITVTEGKEFFWAEKGPMGIYDNHHFKVEPFEGGKTRFIQSDELMEGATFMLGGYLSKTYVKGYSEFNANLKKEVESRNEK